MYKGLVQTNAGRMACCTLALGVLCAPSYSVAESPKSTEPIRIVTNDWTSQIVLSHISGEIFSYMGYSVEYSSLSTAKQWGALARGFDHVQVEVWEGTMADMFGRMVLEKKIIDAGSHSASTREEWWYPDYVEEQCPGLPDWRALKRCAQKFSTAETGGLGRYVAGPWEKPEAAKIRALNLGFQPIAVKKADDLWQELAKAEKNNLPIVLFNWTPNWVEDRYQGKFIEFPTYSPECETDPKWGVNPEYLYDCGNPSAGWLKKAAWSGMAKRWPCALETLKNIDFDNSTIARLSAQVDVDKLTHQQAAQQWLSENTSVWLEWISSECSMDEA